MEQSDTATASPFVQCLFNTKISKKLDCFHNNSIEHYYLSNGATFKSSGRKNDVKNGPKGMSLNYIDKATDFSLST